MGGEPVEDPTRRAVIAAGAGVVLAASSGEAMAADSELSRMGGSALAAAIRSKKASAREVMAACLDQIEAVNPAINAVVSMPAARDPDGPGGGRGRVAGAGAGRSDRCTACRTP